MNIYLDESYNIQKERGKQFISISGFMIQDDKSLRKKWKSIRKTYKGKKRIHATDTTFASLSKKGFDLLKSKDVRFLTIFQVLQELDPREYFSKKDELLFKKVYLDMLKVLFRKLPLDKSINTKIIIEARRVEGEILATNKFNLRVKEYLKSIVKNIRIDYSATPTTSDILLELADIISNTFYKKYQAGDTDFFKEMKDRLIQINNPLKRAD